VVPKRIALVLSAAAAVAVYALLWIGFTLHWQWLDAADSSALDFFHRYGSAHRGWVTGWDVFCTVLGPTPFRVVTLVVIVLALVRRNLRVALFLFLSVELSAVLIEVAKAAADRPRPDTAFVTPLGTSFPSGHALGVLVSVLALLTVALPIVRGPLRGWLIVLGVVVIVAIGLGRVVLNVHHPTDVLAGWALGYAYLVFCLLAVPLRSPIPEADETLEAPGSAR
jgi:undecaprenyl-diphosphatase